MKPHQCSLCHKTFKKERDANMHLRDTHRGEGKIVPTGPRRFGVVVGTEDETIARDNPSIP